MLLLALVGGLVASFSLAGGSTDGAESAAQERATEWSGTVLFEALTPELVQATVTGSDYRRLLAVLQAGILADDRAARVRIWNTTGQLVFSTDQRDEVGTVIPDGDRRIDAALAGDTSSVTTADEEETSGGLAGTDEKLHRTFVPIRLGADLGISGVAEVDQRYAAIEAEASQPWRTARLGLAAAIVVAVILLLLAMRPQPERVAVAEPTGEEGRSALERAAKTEAELRTAIQRAEKAEASGAAAEAALSEAVARIQQAEARAAKAEAAMERATRLSTGVAGSGTGPAAAELERRLRDADAERARLGAELTGLQGAVDARDDRIADLTRTLEDRDAELAQAQRALDAARSDPATAGVEIDETRIVQVEELARQADARIAESEELARAAEARVAEARVVAEQASGRAQEVEARLADAEARLAQAESARAELAARLEAPGDGTPAEPTAAAGGDDLGELRARVAELEEARRTDIAELQRAQESLANTQFEAARAQKRIKELERELTQARTTPPAAEAETLAELLAAEASGDGQAEVVETAMPPAKPSRKRTPKEPSVVEDEAEEAPREDADPALDDQAQSLRERLTRAAAARHRAPAAQATQDDEG